MGDNAGHLTPEELAIREIDSWDIITSLAKPDRPDGDTILAVPRAPFD
jgi:hypothetical protein